MTSEMQVKSFNCNNCGSPLVVPKGSRGHVTCPYCKTECVIEGLVKNAEIQEKENINSGYPLTAEVQNLHQRIVDVLTAFPDMPLDVLDSVEVIKEEHICVPAYLFYCNAMCQFTYDAGNERQHKNQVALQNGKIRTEKENYIEWTQMSNSVSATATIIAPGCREYSDMVNKLYAGADPNELIDFEELDFPYDIVTYSYNLPKNAAFNQYVKPGVESILNKKIESNMQGRTYRNLTPGGTNISKDEIVRVFLGMYHIVYTYRGEEYSVYVTCDGKKYTYAKRPIDAERAAYIKQKQEEIGSLKAPSSALKGWGIILLVAGILITLFGGTVMILAALAGVAMLIVYANKNSQNKKVGDELKRQLEAFEAQAAQAKQQFISADKPLRGIYSPF